MCTRKLNGLTDAVEEVSGLAASVGHSYCPRGMKFISATCGWHHFYF